MTEPAWRLEIIETYRLSLRGKLANLRSLLAQYATSGASDDLERLRVAFHRIRGSAGSYDLGDLGELCSGCEEFVVNAAFAGAIVADVAARIDGQLSLFERIVEREEAR